MVLLRLSAVVLSLLSYSGATTLNSTSTPESDSTSPFCRCEYDATLQLTSIVCKSPNDSDEVADLSDLIKGNCQFFKIDVSNLDINSIPANAFISRPTLKIVYLYSDFIEQIDKEAFTGLKELVDVDLSDNSLLSVDSRLFVDNSLLTSVSLAGNPLIELKSNAPILESNSITSLDLSMCKLTSLSVESFSKLPNLQRLDLSSNNIQQLPVTALQSLPQLNAINLANNRWRCDCAFKEVVDFARTIKKTEGRVRCFTPDKMLVSWTKKTAEEYCPQQESEDKDYYNNDSESDDYINKDDYADDESVIKIAAPENDTEIKKLDPVESNIEILKVTSIPTRAVDYFYIDFEANKVYIMLTVAGVVLGFVTFLGIVVLLMSSSKRFKMRKVARSNSGKANLIPERKSPICRQVYVPVFNNDIGNGHVYEEIA